MLALINVLCAKSCPTFYDANWVVPAHRLNFVVFFFFFFGLSYDFVPIHSTMVQTAKKGKGRAKAGAHAKNILIEKNENAMTPEAKGSRKRTRKGQEAATGKRARSGDDSEFADLQKKYEFLLSVRETEVEAENAKLVAQLSKMEKGMTAGSKSKHRFALLMDSQVMNRRLRL